MYSLKFHPERLLIIAELGGFWDTETAEAYTRDLIALLSMTQRAYPFFRVLVDCERMAVQSREVMQALTPLSEKVMNYCPGPFAIGVTSPLGQIQVAQQFSHQRIRVFADEDIARRWVLGVGQKNLETALKAAPSIPSLTPVRVLDTAAPRLICQPPGWK